MHIQLIVMAAFLASVAHGHGLITSVQGANGVNSTGPGSSTFATTIF
jgi:hypothetical protein